jgi:hypothetical protein
MPEGVAPDPHHAAAGPWQRRVPVAAKRMIASGAGRLSSPWRRVTRVWLREAPRSPGYTVCQPAWSCRPSLRIRGLCPCVCFLIPCPRNGRICDKLGLDSADQRLTAVRGRVPQKVCLQNSLRAGNGLGVGAGWVERSTTLSGSVGLDPRIDPSQERRILQERWMRGRSPAYDVPRNRMTFPGGPGKATRKTVVLPRISCGVSLLV